MDLQTAAQRLSVHYQTAYRWVRAGTLVAVKVGSSYEISEEELQRFLAARQAPVPPPTVTRVRSWADQVERFHERLVAGDELACRTVVDRLHQGGIAAVTLCERLLTPVMARIGEEWAAGQISIAVEHRASAVTEALLVRISEHPSGRPRGVAVVATPPGEGHSLPATMATTALRADRWQVHHLGTGVPAPDLVSLARDVGATLVVVSVCDPSARPEAAALAQAATAAGLRSLVGRPGARLSCLLSDARSADGRSA